MPRPPEANDPPSPPPAAPRRILPAIVLSQFAGTSLWFSGNAILPQLERALALGPQSLADVTSAVQLGFIAGTLVFAVLNVSDRWRPRDVFLACALLGALANAAMVLLPGLERPYGALLALRFVTGFFLAGIYPVGMKIAASWYREGLGRALGYLVGALVLGTALPHLLAASAGDAPWTRVALGVSLLAAGGGVLMHRAVPEGPYLARAPRLDPAAAVRAFGSRAFRSSASGYFGHMWELYTLWAFAPLMIAAYNTLQGAALDPSLWTFCLIAAGGLGCMAGGVLSQRVGSARVAFANLGVSGLCCLLSPLAYLLPPAGFAAFLVVWGFAVAGDSPQFSALNAATAPSAYVGSALTIVNCIGFAISVVSLQAMTLIVQWVPAPWWFTSVAIGPLLGLLVFRPLAAAGR